MTRYEQLRASGSHTASQALAVAFSSNNPEEAVAHALIALAVMRRHVQQGTLPADDCERIAAAVARKMEERLGETASALMRLVPVVE